MDERIEIFSRAKSPNGILNHHYSKNDQENYVDTNIFNSQFDLLDKEVLFIMRSFEILKSNENIIDESSNFPSEMFIKTEERKIDITEESKFCFYPRITYFTGECSKMDVMYSDITRPMSNNSCPLLCDKSDNILYNLRYKIIFNHYIDECTLKYDFHCVIIEKMFSQIPKIDFINTNNLFQSVKNYYISFPNLKYHYNNIVRSQFWLNGSQQSMMKSLTMVFTVPIIYYYHLNQYNIFCFNNSELNHCRIISNTDLYFSKSDCTVQKGF